MNVEFRKVNEVCKFIKGKKPKVLGEKSKKNTIPYVNIKAFETGVVDEFAEEGPYTTCDTSDVLIVWDGSRSGFVGMGIDGYLGSTLAKVQCEKFENKFLYYFFLYLYPEINSRAKGVGIPHVDPQILGNKEIPLMNKNEQLQVISKIDSLFAEIDAGVEELKKTKEKLELYKQSVLNAAIRGKLVPQDPKDEPASKLLERIRAEKEKLIKEGKIKKEKPLPPIDPSEIPFELPEGWEWVRAGEICGFITKGTTPTEDQMKEGSNVIPFIKVYNLTFDGSLNFKLNPTFIPKEVHDKQLSRSKVFPGDVLMNIVGPPMGKVSVVPDIHKEWNVNQAVAIFRPLCGLSSEFISLCLMSGLILGKSIRKGKTTAGQFNFTLEICREICIPIPPLEEQTRICHSFNQKKTDMKEINFLTVKFLDSLSLLKQSILKQAFEGKLI